MPSGGARLVVGGCGYFGSHMVKCLLEAGHEIVAMGAEAAGPTASSR